MERFDANGFCVVTLNIGGRNTNPAEFAVDSKACAKHASIKSRWDDSSHLGFVHRPVHRIVISDKIGVGRAIGLFHVSPGET